MKVRQRGKGMLSAQMPQRDRRMRKAKLGTLQLSGGLSSCDSRLLKSEVGEEKQASKKEKMVFLFSTELFSTLSPCQSLISWLRNRVP